MRDGVARLRSEEACCQVIRSPATIKAQMHACAQRQILSKLTIRLAFLVTRKGAEVDGQAFGECSR